MGVFFLSSGWSRSGEQHSGFSTYAKQWRAQKLLFVGNFFDLFIVYQIEFPSFLKAL